MINFYNEFIEAMGYYDDMVYCMDELDDLFHGMTPTEIIKSVDADFNVYAEYFTHDGMHFISLYSDWDLVEHIKDNGFADEFVMWLLDEEYIKIDVNDYGTWLEVDDFPIRDEFITEESLTRDEVVDFLVDNLYKLVYL